MISLGGRMSIVLMLIWLRESGSGLGVWDAPVTVHG